MYNFFFFPTGYDCNIINDNIDINVVYYDADIGKHMHLTSTLFTIDNVKSFIVSDSYFSLVDGIVLNDLEIATIESALRIIIKEKDFVNFIKIGEYENNNDSVGYKLFHL